MSSSNSFQSNSTKKCPLIDENNFMVWLNKTLMALEIIDCNNLKIITGRPYLPMSQIPKTAYFQKR